MLEHLLCFSVVRMVKVFKVSRTGFYYWIKHRHKGIQREATRQEFDTKVKDAFDNNQRTALHSVMARCRRLTRGKATAVLRMHTAQLKRAGEVA